MTPSSHGRRRPACKWSTAMGREEREKGLTQRAQRTQSSRRRRGNYMRVLETFGLAMIMASLVAGAGSSGGQRNEKAKQEQHEHMQMPAVKPEYPRMGRAQEKA